MTDPRRPDLCRRVRWLAILLGLVAGGVFWWFLIRAQHQLLHRDGSADKEKVNGDGAEPRTGKPTDRRPRG